MEVLEQENLNQIIAAYLEGNSGSSDLVYLENWIKSSKENREYFLQVKNIFESNGLSPRQSEKITRIALNKVMKRITASTNRVKLWHYWQKAAAILFIPLISISLIWNYISLKENRDSFITYNEIFAAIGTRSAIKLPDGSKVWLNSGSSLKYPDKFNNNRREVFLKGEAYFEVQSDKSKPFIVKTQLISVKATGTKFNIAAFDNSTVEVSLLIGKVAVNKVANGKEIETLSEMKPNQHFIYDRNADKSILTDQDVSKFIAWKDGKLIFRNEPLNKVVQKISQLYNVDIELQGNELQKYRYRATFEDESLDEILKLLKLSSPIDYKEISRSPLKDGSFPERRIIIFPNKKYIN